MAQCLFRSRAALAYELQSRVRRCVQIRLVLPGSFQEICSPLDHEPVKTVLSGIRIKIGHVIYEALTLEVKGCIAQNSVPSASFECNKQVEQMFVSCRRNRLKASGSIHMRDGCECVRSRAVRI